jgi:hypothetical protein
MTTSTQNTLGRALAFLDHLNKLNFAYSLKHVRDTLMVVISVPGERWEVEFFENGEIEIERFISSFVDEIDDDGLYKLIAEFAAD